MKQKAFSNIFAWLLCGVLWPGANHAQDAANEGQIIETLVAFDQAFLSGINLTLEATHPTTGFDISQGYCTSIVRITGDGTQLAMDCRQIKMNSPRFAANRLEPDYEEDGNYVVNFTKNLSVYLGPDSWKTRIDQERQAVDPANAVVRATPASPLFEVRTVGHQDPKNRVFRYLLPLGRGFSDLLEKITSSTPLEDGLLRITATGSLFSPNMGEWEIVLDPQSDYLIQSATFTREGSDTKATVVCDTMGGQFDGGLSLWNKGAFQLASNYDISVQLIAFSDKTDGNLLGQIEQAAQTIQENATLIDFGVLDANGKPLVLRGIGAPE
jgi:hypothetical protein